MPERYRFELAPHRAKLARVSALPPPRSWVAWCVLAILIGGWVLATGPSPMVDSAAYSYWADRLIEQRFDHAALVREHGSAVGLTYALFVTLGASLKLLFGTGWASALVVLNAAAMATVGMLLVRLAAQLTGSGAAAWTALLLYAGCWDVLQWAPRVGSDGTFLLVAYAVFLMEARRVRSGGGRWLPVFAASAAASLYRPTGIVLFPITFWSFYLARSRDAGGAWPRAMALALLCAAATAGALAAAWLWQDPGRWPFGFAAPEVAAIARTYEQGQVVWDRLGTYHPPPREIWDYWAITADRFVHFFAPAAAEFSPAHRAVQLLFYVPVYLLGGWFALALLRGRTGLGAPERDVFLAALGALLCYAFFHGVVQVDFDWRYRLPVMPHLVLLAAGGVAMLIRGARPA